MARLAKADVHAALERAGQNIITAAGDDPFVSRKDIRNFLNSLTGVEKSLTDIFYRFIDARDAEKGARVTKKDVEAALEYSKEKLIDQYDLNNNGLSSAEIERMSTTGKLAVAFARILKEQASSDQLKGADAWTEALGELSEGLLYSGYANEADSPLDPIYFEGSYETLNQLTFAEAAGLDTSKPSEELAIYEETTSLIDPERTYDLSDLFGNTGFNRALEINHFASKNLRQFRSIVVGRDDNTMVEHPQYFVGLTPTGAVAGYRHILIWT